MKTIKAWKLAKNYLKNKVKIYMTNENLTDEEIKILKKQDRFTKLPYLGPKDWLWKKINPLVLIMDVRIWLLPLAKGTDPFVVDVTR